MSYLEIYKKRMGAAKRQAHDERHAKVKNTTNRNFVLIDGYHPAVLEETIKEEVKIDVAVKSGTSELQKYIIFRPDVRVKTGSYITYNDKTYILKEMNTDFITPRGDCYFCNQSINFEGLSFPIPCYTNSTTYGSKGIIDQQKIYELDSKTKVYIQRNKYTETLRIGQRIMFANEYVYKITEIDDLVFKGMYTIVCQRDEILPMDDFENNLAFNEYYTPVEPDIPPVAPQPPVATITGDSVLRIGAENNYQLDNNVGNVTWSIDEPTIATIVNSSDTEATIRGLKAGWVTLEAKQGQTSINKMDIIVTR